MWRGIIELSCLLRRLWRQASPLSPPAPNRRINLEPYSDAAVPAIRAGYRHHGDHSAGEMQRFMLGTLDKRLRSVNPAVFDDPRNVDATLMYAMSGGNLRPLEYLVAKDTSGHFDNRVTDVLRKYLSGKGSLIQKTLTGMVPEYRNQRIGPYLALIAGNVVFGKEPKDALQYYDWARLGARERSSRKAALRRSLAISVEVDMVVQGLSYSSQICATLRSLPLCQPVCGSLRKLVVKHFGKVTGKTSRTRSNSWTMIGQSPFWCVSRDRRRSTARTNWRLWPPARRKSVGPRLELLRFHCETLRRCRQSFDRSRQ